MEHPRLWVHLSALAVLLTLPALWLGWQLDDYSFRFILLGQGEGQLAPSRVFNALQGDATFNAELMDIGILPWWTDQHFRLAFFRYLTVLTMWLDYRLWPENAMLMHAQSLLWFAALGAAVTLCYRRLFGPGLVSGLAALLYVLDDARAVPAVWLANRNALTAAFFGVLCLWAHDRWRRDDWRAGAAVAPFFLALSLASAEMGLGTVAYLVAHALCLDRGSVGRRLRALAPHGAVFVVWAGVYRAFGYGVEGSALYLDPIANTGAYLSALPHRAVFNLLGQWTPIAAEAGSFLPDDVQGALWLIALGAIVVIAWALMPLLRRDARARFSAVGMLLSLLPVAGTFAANRLLMFVGLGGMGLTAAFLAGVFAGADWLPHRGFRRVAFRVLGWMLIVSHLVIAPIGLALGSSGTRALGDAERTAIATLPADPAIAAQDLVIVNAPDFLVYVMHVQALKTLAGEPFPRRVRALAPAPVPLIVERVDDRTIDIRLQGSLFAGPLAPLFQNRQRPVEAGHRVELTGMTVTVLEANGRGDVSAARFMFDVPLEDSSLRWVRWEGEGYVPFVPPAIGGRVELAPARGLLEELR
jgi:hypothetical protein